MGLAPMWDLWGVDTETHMTEIVADMVANNVTDFVVQFYEPHSDLGLFQLEHVSWPYSQDSSCAHEHYSCEPPGEVLWKSTHPLLSSRIPEVEIFLQRFALSNYEDNTFLSEQYANDWDWEQTACEWIKEFNSTWQNWIVDIVR